jgi:PAS domain S-box-containing protein
VLQLVLLEWERSGDQTDLEKLIKHDAINKDYFTGVTVTNQEGEVVKASFKLNPRFKNNVKNLPGFIYHLQNAKGGLYIGHPVHSPTLGFTLLPIARRINDGKGNFAGVVTVLIKPSTFTSFYANANLRPNDIISFVSPKGITYARRTGTKESWGENISKSPLYKHLATNEVNNYFAPDAIRNIPTFFSYRKLKDYPIIATVGSARGDILEHYYQRTSIDRLYTIGITVLIFLFSVLVGMVLLNRKSSLQKIKESETKYRSIFENSQEAIFLMHPNGKIITTNPAACKAFAMSEKEICKKSFLELVDQSEEQPTTQFIDQLMAEKGNKEVYFLQGNGSHFIGEVVASKHTDAEGNQRCIVIVRDITERKRMAEKLFTEQQRFQLKVTEQVIIAQEREREVIGRELHDNVNQVLTTVKLYLDMAMTNKETRDLLIPKSIHHVVQSINEIRNLSRDLSAPTLGTQSLVDSLSALVEVVESSSGLKINFTHDTEASLNKDQKLGIYRIVQEQLNNVIKHANATVVHLSLVQSGNKMLLTIKDNGRGFNTTLHRSGIGINNIISRVKVFNGSVRIEAAPGKGCTLYVSIPVQAPGAFENDKEAHSSLPSIDHTNLQ